MCPMSRFWWREAPGAVQSRANGTHDIGRLVSEDRPVDDDPPEEGTSATPSDAEQGAGLEPSPEAEAALAYHQRARLAEDRLAEVLAAYRTLKKETESFRDRMSRNMERRFQQRHARLLLKFMDILDNLDRAL